MTILDIIALVVLIAFVPIGFLAAPKYWRNEVGFYEAPPSWWPLGGAFWRGSNRSTATPVCPFFFLFLSVTFIGVSVDRGWADVVFKIGALGYVPVMVLFFSVALLNRPRFIVPPHLRRQPGAIAEWLGAEPKPIDPPDRVVGRSKSARRSQRRR